MKDRIEHIKARIVFPMIVAGFLLILFSLMGGYWLQKNAIEDSVDQRISGVNRLFKEILKEESQLMNGQIDFIKSEHAFSDTFLAGKRSELSEMALPFFEGMRSKYRITHFYFHSKDQVCFLRVHSPSRYGDLIERFTMKRAVSTAKPFYGIELGPLGTFTLRTVHPWIVGGKLEGYIELGMEIEHITRLINQALNLELLVLIEKKFLNREGWEAGLKILNRKGNWELFSDFVIVDGTMETTSVLDEKLRFHKKDDGEIFSVEIGSSHYKGEFSDLVDAGGRRLGEIVSMVDVTTQYKNLQVLILIIAGISLMVGVGLLLFFSSFIGRIQNQLISSKEKLLSEIDARLKSEEALALSEKRFRSVFDECKDAIVSTDKDGNLQLLNPSGIELFGLSASIIESINFRDLYEDEATGRKFSAAISQRGFVRDFGVQLKGKDGKTMDCFMTVTTKKGGDGAVIGYEGIVRDVTPYKKMELELRRLATTDYLTGINNRRYFSEMAQKEINRSSRYGHSFSLIMLDIDHFKKINDTYGHSAGDQVLREFCDLCLKAIRDSDIMGRIGGEEFAIALVVSDIRAAEIIAERIKKTVASHSVSFDKEKINFTVSLGITEMCTNDNLDSILERADKALYQAKKNGRNQVRICIMKDNQSS